MCSHSPAPWLAPPARHAPHPLPVRCAGPPMALVSLHRAARGKIEHSGVSLDRVPCGWHVMAKTPDENTIRTSVPINACQFGASSSILWRHPLTAGPSFLMGVLGAAAAALASRSVSQNSPSYTAWGRHRLPLLRAALQAAACYMTVRNSATTEDEETLSRSGIAEPSCAFFPVVQPA